MTLQINDPVNRPDGAYWLKNHSGYAIVCDGRIAEIVRLWFGPILWQYAKRKQIS